MAGRMNLALACAVDPLAAIGSFPLWEPVVMSTSVQEHTLWKQGYPQGDGGCFTWDENCAVKGDAA